MKYDKIYTEIQSEILKMLESAKVSKIQKPWFAAGLELAKNPYSNTIYKGFNQFYLSLFSEFKNYPVNNWLTFKQISKLQGEVIKGSKAVPVTFYQILFKHKGNKITFEDALTIKDSTGKTFEELGITSQSYTKFYYVFNVSQTKKLPNEYYKTNNIVLNDIEKIDKAENIILNTGAVIKNVLGDSAHYNLVEDEIILPVIGQFNNSLDYYSTAFHELSHWTGSKERLNRSFGKKFGDKDYAFEELIAELSAALICGTIQITKNFTNNADYIDSWLEAFKKDIKVFFKATGYAQKSADYILNCSNVAKKAA